MGEATGKRPGRLVRWFFATPKLFYRLGLPGYERLFGLRWILVTTKGRRTGKPRSVLLDLVGHDPATGRYYIQPGWERAAWVRNIEAHPCVEAQVGRRHFRARVIDASGPEGAAWMQAFTKQHPLQSMILGKILGLQPPSGDDAQMREWFATTFRVFGLDPIDPAHAGERQE